jgi:hypothetical protein
MERWAVIDDTGKYRYTLTRVWDANKAQVAFVMLNPSVADGQQDDPTIRKCVGFAQRWGYGSLGVVNMYAWRATSPKDLDLTENPVGKKNDAYIERVVQNSSCVIAAWGAHAKEPTRLQEMLSLIGNAFCLGRTKNGSPRHPLYVRYEVQPSIYCKEGVIAP